MTQFHRNPAGQNMLVFFGGQHRRTAAGERRVGCGPPGAVWWVAPRTEMVTDEPVRTCRQAAAPVASWLSEASVQAAVVLPMMPSWRATEQRTRPDRREAPRPGRLCVRASTHGKRTFPLRENGATAARRRSLQSDRVRTVASCSGQDRSGGMTGRAHRVAARRDRLTCP
eukprot:COSAG02_NODE_12088_length_1599_cov_77.612000_1_plen_170_part_00